MRILVAEDDPTSAFILEQILENEGYKVDITKNGEEAFLNLKNKHYDVLLTDWMMPKMNGIELIKKTRAEIINSPVIILITALSSTEAKNHAIESGADEFLSKPVYPKDVLEALSKSMSAINQKIKIPVIHDKPPKKEFKNIPFIPVLIGASSGGPPALIEVFKNISIRNKAVFFIVLHGPAWMLETFAEFLENDTLMTVKIAQNLITPELGTVYIAPGDFHLEIDEKTFQLKLNKNPMENYSRPSVDTLFRSAAKAFGQKCLGIILTGMGCDGSMGAINIFEAGGTLIAQDPKTAIVGSMPQRIIDLGIASEIVDLKKIGSRIDDYIKNYNQ